ncbi:hypothetical protein [Paenibacillus hamazuiensis]|uniref:hypothetical protein n=1 Tax=Paenibacillus hamazuiensis TaxID=2936508 RepID=UPI00200E3351|nr:hypothetical protein [Paenibacillus hamazuiensis]
MWESVLNREHLEIQADQSRKSVLLRIKKAQPAAEAASLHLNESEFFEVIHTLLTINRTFNQPANYFDAEKP